jgi:hypothetical protein
MDAGITLILAIKFSHTIAQTLSSLVDPRK